MMQKDLTEKQRVFLEFATVHKINDERRFWITLLGGKPSESENIGETVREESLKRLKNPYDLPKPEIKR
jgi:hypothetical protein